MQKQTVPADRTEIPIQNRWQKQLLRFQLFETIPPTNERLSHRKQPQKIRANNYEQQSKLWLLQYWIAHLRKQNKSCLQLFLVELNLKFTSNGRSKTTTNTNCTSRGQHFTVARFILINCLKRCHHFTQQLCNNTCNVHKRTLKWNNAFIWIDIYENWSCFVRFLNKTDETRVLGFSVENNKNMPLTSFPSGIPLPRVAVNPITLATRVLNVKYSFNVTPRKMVFISGIPEPILCGAMRWTNPAEKRIKHTGNETHAKYWIYGCDVKSLYNQILAVVLPKKKNNKKQKSK